MRKISVLLFLLIPGLAIAQTPSVIPFHLTKTGLIGISTTINKTRTRGVLDSGAGGILISTGFAKALGLKLGQPVGQGVGGGKGPETLFLVHLKSVSLGPVTLRNTPAFASNLRYMSEDAGFHVNALLGYPFFANHVVTVDYPKQTVTIADKHHAPHCDSPIPLKIKHNVPMVTARAILPKRHLSRTVHLVVDLGSYDTAAFLGGKVLDTKMGKLLSTHKNPSVVGNGVGGPVNGIKTKLPKLELAGQSFHDLPVILTRDIKAFNGKYADGSLGVLFWDQGSITFDYADHMLCIQPSQT